MNTTIFTRLGGRSFILCVGCGLVCSLMRWHDKLTDGSYTAIIMGTVGAYIAHAAFSNRSQIRADVDKVALTRDSQS